MLSWLTLTAARKVLGRAGKWIAGNWFQVLVLGSLAAGGVYVWHLRYDRDAYQREAELAETAVQSVERERDQWIGIARDWHETAQELQRANEAWADAADKYDTGLRELLTALQSQPPPPGYTEAEGAISAAAGGPDPATAIVETGAALAGLTPPE